MNKRLNAEDFNVLEPEKREILIDMICDLKFHNFVSKEALVEIVKFQNERIKMLEEESVLKR